MRYWGTYDFNFQPFFSLKLFFLIYFCQDFMTDITCFSAFRFDLLDVCINGPKEKLDSTVISQVCFKGFCYV